jgi:flavin reductase (DIM6/NTAB) family NADH-FMN oxidoreductase RutF
LIIISLNAESHTNRLVSRAGAFAVTILSASQQVLSERFAGRLSEAGSRLDGLETETLVTGAPFLKGGLAYLDCRVTQTIPSGMNTLFIAEVVAARVFTSRGYDHKRALIYHDRKYHKLED